MVHANSVLGSTSGDKVRFRFENDSSTNSAPRTIQRLIPGLPPRSVGPRLRSSPNAQGWWDSLVAAKPLLARSSFLERHHVRADLTRAAGPRPRGGVEERRARRGNIADEADVEAAERAGDPGERPLPILPPPEP